MSAFCGGKLPRSSSSSGVGDMGLASSLTSISSFFIYGALCLPTRGMNSTLVLRISSNLSVGASAKSHFLALETGTSKATFRLLQFVLLAICDEWSQLHGILNERVLVLGKRVEFPVWVFCSLMTMGLEKALGRLPWAVVASVKHRVVFLLKLISYYNIYA
jgi:hypothetical protein